ncbi:MAG: YezD family protein [Verrucomicrobiales bacterium]|nr:YezD family protein [Verrucomicrobiales bacterium]
MAYPRVHAATNSGDSSAPDRWLDLIQSQVNGIRFGVVQITVHEGRVVLVERTERFRLDPQPSHAGAHRD